MKIASMTGFMPDAARTPADWRGWMGQICVRLETDTGLVGYGMGGGGPGKAGCNYLQHQDGHRTEFPAQGQVDAKAGDVMVIETPGGGGFGAVTD